MKRLGLLSGTTLVLLLLDVAAAWACNPPGIGVTAPDPAYPGDPIYYTVTNMASGATYSVKVNNTVVISKRPTSTDAPVSGEFALPDMGPGATSLAVQVTVEHGDIENGEQAWDTKSQQNVQYGGASRPAAEPEQTSGAGATPGETTQQQPQQSQSGSPAPAAAPPASAPVTAAPPSSGGGPARASEPRRQPSRVSHRAPARERTTVRHAEVVIGPPAAEPAIGAPVGEPAVPPTSKARAGVEHLPNAATITIPAREVAALARERAASSLSLRASQQTDATRDLVLLALALTLGLLLMRRRGFGRPTPDPEPDPEPPGGDPIEAELQEIIAEERARAERLLAPDA